MEVCDHAEIREIERGRYVFGAIPATFAGTASRQRELNAARDLYSLCGARRCGTLLIRDDVRTVTVRGNDRLGAAIDRPVLLL
ncbi:MAG TPA: hypothetical protein VMK12_07495 [Anaeromyxobacteraceae bacterium]|nr:hypothetical protein [Anaeromyxobacteraceae bacterium]